MAKKNYESPKMDEVKVNVEQDLLSGSNCDVETTPPDVPVCNPPAD